MEVEDGILSTWVLRAGSDGPAAGGGHGPVTVGVCTVETYIFYIPPDPQRIPHDRGAGGAEDLKDGGTFRRKGVRGVR